MQMRACFSCACLHGLLRCQIRALFTTSSDGGATAFFVVLFACAVLSSYAVVLVRRRMHLQRYSIIADESLIAKSASHAVQYGTGPQSV
jgi:hypothetical protein